MLKPKVLGGKVIKVGHLERYIKEVGYREESG